MSKVEWVNIGSVKLVKFPEPHPDYTPKEDEYIDANGVLEVLAWAWRKNKDVLCIGDTGTGKTAAIRKLCAMTNAAYRRFPCHEATDTSTLLGQPKMDGKRTYFQRGIAYDATLNGHVLLLDEYNAAHPDVRLALNPLFNIDEGRLVIAENEGEIVERHPNFRLFATGNPYSYAGVKEWNAAIMSRFDLVLHFDYLPQEDEEELLAKQVTGTPPDRVRAMVKAANAVRTSRREQTISFPMSYREIQNWAIASKTFTVKQAAEYTVVNKCDEEDRDGVRELLKAQFADWR
jgi:cobaltochelatase CobS